MTSDTTTSDDDAHTYESKAQSPPNLRASDDADEDHRAGTSAPPWGPFNASEHAGTTAGESSKLSSGSWGKDLPATPPESTPWAPESAPDEPPSNPRQAVAGLSAPAGLDVDGAALWQSITAKYALRPDEVPLLEAYARAVDDLALLRKALAEAGSLIVAGSKGQARVHPVMAEIRAQAGLCARLASQLGLPDDDGERVGATPASRKAIRAANSRWLRHGPHLIEGTGYGDS